jgi:hypothetical protein
MIWGAPVLRDQPVVRYLETLFADVPNDLSF